MLTVGVSSIAFGQEGAVNQAAVTAGKDLLFDKCFQCHTDAMWRDQRQDARAWEATLYRMVGRGAIWSGEDIKNMAAFMGTEFGPNASSPSPKGK